MTWLALDRLIKVLLFIAVALLAYAVYENHRSIEQEERAVNANPPKIFIAPENGKGEEINQHVDINTPYQ